MTYLFGGCSDRHKVWSPDFRTAGVRTGDPGVDAELEVPIPCIRRKVRYGPVSGDIGRGVPREGFVSGADCFPTDQSSCSEQ